MASQSVRSSSSNLNVVSTTCSPQSPSNRQGSDTSASISSSGCSHLQSQREGEAKYIKDAIVVFTQIFQQLKEVVKYLNQSVTITEFQTPESILKQEVISVCDKWINENQASLCFLKWLNLSDLQLSYLPFSLQNLIALEYLDLSNNNFEILSPNLKALKNLKILNLADNQINSLPSWIGEFPFLDILTLSNNKLSSLPKEIKNLSNLNQIDLDGNNFTAIPDVLVGMRALPGSGKRLNVCIMKGEQNDPWPDPV